MLEKIIKSKDSLGVNIIETRKRNISEIRKWAISLHEGQKYGVHDYSYHLDQVFNLALKYNLDNDTLIATYLHDTIEDCGLCKENIEQKTNKNIAEMVWAVSGFGKNRKERKADMIEKMHKYHNSINLKMLDRFVNILNCKENNLQMYAMYVEEMDSYKDVFKLGSDLIYRDLCKLIELPLENEKIAGNNLNSKKLNINI